jgi:hypothetical protein
MLMLEIAGGVFLELFAFVLFWRWRLQREASARLEERLRGLTVDQLHMLRGIRDPAEQDRVIDNMLAHNELVSNMTRNLTE